MYFGQKPIKFWLPQKEFYPIVYISLQTTWNILICRWHLHWTIIWISKLQNKKMAHRTMPILYLNLCGEMLYIIDQRLIDTKTDPEKQIKGTLFKLILSYQAICHVKKCSGSAKLFWNSKIFWKINYNFRLKN